MRREIVEQHVEGFGKVTARELTVAELAQLINKNGSSDNPILDTIFAPHDVTTAAINQSLGLDLRDLGVVDIKIDDSKCDDSCYKCNQGNWPAACPIKDYELRSKEEATPHKFSEKELRYCEGCSQCVDICENGVFEFVYKEYLPSALIQLAGIFKKVNPAFTAGENHQKKTMENNLRMISFVKEEEQKKQKGK